MEAVCPHCQRPLDPTRAPVARIVGLKVLSFCSAKCADEAARGEPPPAPVGESEPHPPTVTPRPASPDEAPLVSARAEDPREIGLATEDSVRRQTSARATTEDEMEPERALAPSAPLKLAAMSLKKRIIAAASSAVLLLGVVIVAIEACPSQSDVRAAAVPSPNETQRPAERRTISAEPGPVAETPAKPDEIDPEVLYDRAVQSLRELLRSSSPRLQRVAAMALSRTGDAAATEALRSLMRKSDSTLVKVQIAYSLARAGDESGRRALVASLSDRDRDTRLDAASSLVRLGDDAGAGVLRNLLSYRRFRVGAAGLLARLGDERGLAALRSALHDDGVSNEIKMRATVALGVAGDDSVKNGLIAILDEGKYQVGAAQALAALGDRVAVPALTKHLGLDSFRVSAALSLRRLGEKVDLEPLAVALQTGNDVARVTSAEAILILTGPKKLAEID